MFEAILILGGSFVIAVAGAWWMGLGDLVKEEWNK
jgi:hypothetical protein